MRTSRIAAAVMTAALLTGTIAPLTLAQTSSQVSLSASSNPMLAGSSVIFTASVSPSSATGTITFQDGSSVIGTATLSNGTATFLTSSLTTGTHIITAAYGGDNNVAPSTSAALLELVSPATASTSTSVVLSSGTNPSSAGNAVAFTATLSTVGATGTVTVYDGTTFLGTATAVNGVATFTTSALSVGIHSILAVYGGDSAYQASASNVVSQTVRTVVGQTTVHLSANGNPVSLGNPVTFTANVYPLVATGNVTFYDGSAVLGVASIAGGTAAVSTSSLTAGVHSITATYSGNETYASATSNTLLETVGGTTPLPPGGTFDPAQYLSIVNTQVAAVTAAIDTYASALKAAWQARASAISVAAALTDQSQAQAAIRAARTAFSQSQNQAQQQYNTVVRQAESALQGFPGAFGRNRFQFGTNGEDNGNGNGMGYGGYGYGTNSSSFDPIITRFGTMFRRSTRGFMRSF